MPKHDLRTQRRLARSSHRGVQQHRGSKAAAGSHVREQRAKRVTDRAASRTAFMHADLVRKYKKATAAYLAAEAARKAAEDDLAAYMQAREAKKQAQKARNVAAIAAKRERKLAAEHAAPLVIVPSVPNVEIAAAM